MDKKLLSILACVKCKGKVKEDNGKLVCVKCGHEYEIKEGIPVMMV